MRPSVPLSIVVIGWLVRWLPFGECGFPDSLDRWFAVFVVKLDVHWWNPDFLSWWLLMLVGGSPGYLVVVGPAPIQLVVA